MPATRRNLNAERKKRAANRKPYDSDLNDDEWILIAPVFYKPKKIQGEEKTDAQSGKSSMRSST